jgi:hypothetical protein
VTAASLTTQIHGRIVCPAPAHSGARIGVLSPSGESRVESIPRLFSCLALPCSMGGRAGEPKGSPVLGRYANPVRSLTSIGVERGRYSNRNRADTMPTQRTQAAPSAHAQPRLVPGHFLTDNALHRLRRCASIADQLSGLTTADIELARMSPQALAAIADFLADDLRVVIALASPATGPEPYAETDTGTARDAAEAALLALWRTASPDARTRIATAAGSPLLAA